jgi:hypothetical protein
MLRGRTVITVVAILLILGAGPAAAGEEPPRRDEPAVTIVEAANSDGDEAWTFRFLVPTLIAMSAIGIGLTAFGYLRSVKRRYRVER